MTEPSPESGTPQEAAAAAPPPARPWKKRIRRVLLVAILSPLIVFTLYTVVVYNWAYSQGDRSGILRKFSKKGWLCKSWEGELALTSVPGVMPELWSFTVRDDSVAVRVNGALGRNVVLHYREHRGLWTSCFGETSYFVDSVRAVPAP
jgi:hypothetical protein